MALDFKVFQAMDELYLLRKVRVGRSKLFLNPVVHLTKTDLHKVVVFHKDMPFQFQPIQFYCSSRTHSHRKASH